jgi:hypothetical protein
MDIQLQMLASYGFKHGRCEIGWGNQDYKNTSKIDNTGAAEELTLLKKHGIRPLILLNSNSGAPAPAINYMSKVTLPVKVGDTTLTLDKDPGFIVGYSGASNLDGYVQAGHFFTKIDGLTMTLSKPLTQTAVDTINKMGQGCAPKNAKVAGCITTSTFKYLPFSPSNTTEFGITIAGWATYVTAIANFAIDILGTRGNKDLGFDLEVWNELTFGSDFLDIENYYSKTAPKYSYKSPKDILELILNTTAALTQSTPELFKGVHVGNGFANTIPWPAASRMPLGITSINKHPYHGYWSHVANGTGNYHATQVDALGGRPKVGEDRFNVRLSASGATRNS